VQTNEGASALGHCPFADDMPCTGNDMPRISPVFIMLARCDTVYMAKMGSR